MSKKAKSALTAFAVVALVLLVIAVVSMGHFIILIAISAPLAVILFKVEGVGQFVAFMGYLLFAAIMSGAYLFSAAFSGDLIAPIALSIGALAFSSYCAYVIIDDLWNGALSEAVATLRNRDQNKPAKP